MKTQPEQKFFSHLKSDIPAAVVVFLVALPLCLGIAMASGAPLFSGIIAGIVGGIVVALISGSNLGVSGPAAGLVVIVITAIKDLGAIETFFLAVVIAGVIQLIMGLLKAGVIGYYFPSSVIKGMLTGIGIIIILKQIPHVFGYDKDPEGDLAFSQLDGHNTFSEIGYMWDAISPGATIIAFLSLAILILWEQGFMKRIPLFKIIQGPLIAVAAGIGLNYFFQNDPTMALKSEQVVNIPVAGSLEEFIGLFSLPNFSQWANPQVYVVALTLAVVASLETLLCVEATDKLDPNKRVTPTNRELMAQGVGNMVSGFIGGLPITQVIVRSSANIQSGGKSKASAFIHGLLLLSSAMFIPEIINMVPLASLAAILLVVGYKLAKPAIFKAMFLRGKSQFIPFIVTILGIIFTDLLIGIGLGLMVGIIQILWKNYQTPYHFDPKSYVKGEPIVIQLAENVSFLNKASILHTLDTLPDDAHVIIDGTKNKSMHPDILEIIEDFHENAKTKNIKLELRNLQTFNTINPVGEFTEMVNEENGEKAKTEPIKS